MSNCMVCRLPEDVLQDKEDQGRQQASQGPEHLGRVKKVLYIIGISI